MITWHFIMTNIQTNVTFLFAIKLREEVLALVLVTRVLVQVIGSQVLSLSFPVKGASHRPNPFQKVPEASWISYEQMPAMSSQESNPGGCGTLLGG